jgi:hypothetical protein
MIELPRAALTADRSPSQAEFFSFGTNDLTQTTFGLSRDDAGSFLPRTWSGVLPHDPFQSSTWRGSAAGGDRDPSWGARRAGLKVGICGEHGGDPRSVDFFHRAGLDYVSCSPYRVPVARLAAAHAAKCEVRSAKCDVRRADLTSPAREGGLSAFRAGGFNHLRDLRPPSPQGARSRNGFTGIPFHHETAGSPRRISKWRCGLSAGALPEVPT